MILMMKSREFNFMKTFRESIIFDIIRKMKVLSTNMFWGDLCTN